MASIFISYRQDDAKAWAISLRDDLAEIFGKDQVFLDNDTLHAGNWREQIEGALKRCKVVLVVIGPRWLTITDAQKHPRIQLADDVHHQEVAIALSRRDITVIPVLVDDAPMLRAEQLPEDLQKLSEQQARKIGDTQAHRNVDLAVLVKDIQSIGAIKPQRGADRQALPTTPLATPVRIGWLRLDTKTLGSVFALTLLAGMVAYVENLSLSVPELSFLAVVFYAVVLSVRWLWARVRQARKETT